MSGEAILSDYERMEKKNRIRGDDNQKGKKNYQYIQAPTGDSYSQLRLAI